MRDTPHHHAGGTHLTADLSGCSASHPWMTQKAPLSQACLDAVRSCELTVVGECFHAFAPLADGQAAGITGVVLLAESHLAIHTWPESGQVTIDVFICHMRQDNRMRAHQLIEQLINGFAPSQCRVQAIERTMPAMANT